jgi:hypothetical protein
MIQTFVDNKLKVVTECAIHGLEIALKVMALARIEAEKSSLQWSQALIERHLRTAGISTHIVPIVEVDSLKLHQLDRLESLFI